MAGPCSTWGYSHFLQVAAYPNAAAILSTFFANIMVASWYLTFPAEDLSSLACPGCLDVYTVVLWLTCEDMPMVAPFSQSSMTPNFKTCIQEASLIMVANIALKTAPIYGESIVPSFRPWAPLIGLVTDGVGAFVPLLTGFHAGGCLTIFPP